MTKLVFFECDTCHEASTPAPTVKDAVALAKSEGFVFSRGSHYCSVHSLDGVTLTNVQFSFLEIVYDNAIESFGNGWFNRKDVFCDRLNYMPFSVGLALYKKGLLETDPPNHPSGHDLSFRITEKGKDIVNDRAKK